MFTFGYHCAPTRVPHLTHSTTHPNPIFGLDIPYFPLIMALSTAELELNYERSLRIVEGVSKDEDIRKLKIRIHIVEDEVEELNEQLTKEEERSDGLVQDLEEAVAKMDELDAENQALVTDLRVKSRDLENTKVCYYTEVF
jgi:uncharacterized coiled-coil protein SlyX